MSLPSNDELQELIDEALEGPWNLDDCSAEEDDTLEPLLRITDCHGATIAEQQWHYTANPQLDPSLHLAALAPQLAEEVIRLREEIDRLKSHCRDRALVADAEARLADNEREKAWQRGRAEAYYDTYLQITQGQHKEHE